MKGYILRSPLAPFLPPQQHRLQIGDLITIGPTTIHVKVGRMLRKKRKKAGKKKPKREKGSMANARLRATFRLNEEEKEHMKHITLKFFLIASLALLTARKYTNGVSR